MEYFLKWNQNLFLQLSTQLLKMEAAGTPETSISFYEVARRNIPEHNHFEKRSFS
jgi:hypothetical protein